MSDSRSDLAALVEYDSDSNEESVGETFTSDDF